MRRIFIYTFFLLLLSMFFTGCQNQNINITDKIAPEFIGLDDEMLLNVGSNEPDWLKWVSVVDNNDGVINADQITVDSSKLKLNTPGVYPVTFSVKDSSGNSSVKTVNVTVRTLNDYEQFNLLLQEIQKELNHDESFRLDIGTDIKVLYAHETGLGMVTTKTDQITVCDKKDFYLETFMSVDGQLFSHTVTLSKDNRFYEYAVGGYNGKKYARPINIDGNQDTIFDEIIGTYLSSLSDTAFTDKLTYTKVTDNSFSVTGSIRDYVLGDLSGIWASMGLPEELLNSLVLTVDVAYDPVTGAITMGMNYAKFSYEGAFDAMYISINYSIENLSTVAKIDPTSNEYTLIATTLEDAKELNDINQVIASPFYPNPDYFKVRFESGQYELSPAAALPEDIDILDSEGNKVDLGSDWGQPGSTGYNFFNITAGEYYIVVNKASATMDGGYSFLFRRSYEDEITAKLRLADSWIMDADNYRLTKDKNEVDHYDYNLHGQGNYTRYFTFFNDEIYYEMQNYYDGKLAGYFVLKESEGKVFTFNTEVQNAANYVTTNYVCEASAFSETTLNDLQYDFLVKPVFAFSFPRGMIYTKLDDNHYKIAGTFNSFGSDTPLALFLGLTEDQYIMDEAYFDVELIFNPEQKTFELKSQVFNLDRVYQRAEQVDYTMNIKIDRLNACAKLDMTKPNFIYYKPSSIDTITETTPITQPITSTEPANPHFYRVELEQGHYGFLSSGINVSSNLKLYDVNRNEVDLGPVFSSEHTFYVDAGTYYIGILNSDTLGYSLEFSKLNYSDYGDISQPEDLTENVSGTLEGDYDMKIYHLTSPEAGVLTVHYTVSTGSLELYEYNPVTKEAGYHQNAPQGVKYLPLSSGDNYLIVAGATDEVTQYSLTYEMIFDNPTPAVLDDMIPLTDEFTPDYYLVGFNNGPEYFRLDINVAGYYLIEFESALEGTQEPMVTFYSQYNMEVTSNNLRGNYRFLSPGTYYIKVEQDSYFVSYFKVKYSIHTDQTEIIPFAINDMSEITMTDEMTVITGTIMTSKSYLYHEFTLAEESLVAFKRDYYGKCELLDQNNNLLSFYQELERMEYYRLPPGTYRLRFTPTNYPRYPYTYNIYAGRVMSAPEDDHMAIISIPTLVLDQNYTIVKNYAGDIDVFQINITIAGNYTVYTDANFTYYGINHLPKETFTNNTSRVVYLNPGTYYFAFQQWRSVGYTSDIRVISGASY